MPWLLYAWHPLWVGAKTSLDSLEKRKELNHDPQAVKSIGHYTKDTILLLTNSVYK
jgi:hypothetical protein